jgi:hypothetical protein
MYKQIQKMILILKNAQPYFITFTQNDLLQKIQQLSSIICRLENAHD